MSNNIIKSLCLVCALSIVLISNAQQTKQFTSIFENPFQSKISNVKSKTIRPLISIAMDETQKSKPRIEITNGSFFSNIERYSFTKEFAVSNVQFWFNLTGDHTFLQTSERKDELGFTHTYLQQYYKGFIVEGAFIMLHSKSDKISTINGQIAEFENLETIQKVTNDQALAIAKKHLNVNDLINSYPIETVITRFNSIEGKITKLALKVRIDSYKPFVMCNVYVDAQTSVVLNKVNLIAHADVSGTGQTLYSGSQSITIDNYTSGGFRLRESGRKIETYDASNSTGLSSSGFTGSSDFTNNSSSFNGLPVLNSFSIVAVAQSWWYSSFADQLPDLYIKIKDASNKVVYTSKYYNNQNPKVTFDNINVLMSNPPYTAEVWDYDAGNTDDFGGTYNISTSIGTQNWSGNGNNGNYNVTNSGHPAVDVHWGMEKTYDFYLNVFNRNSFDGNGSKIKQYLNPPDLQSQKGNSPNNAFAISSPYNIMAYGMGDGNNMSPVVGLDVEGHEFSHMVIDNNGNGGLTYEGESGALNESFADIFGICVEFYSGVNADWLMGEDIMVSSANLRSMSDPNNSNGSSQQPDTYNGTYWEDPSNLSSDNGGVHTNSGVQNFWFYLLCQGGSGTNDLSDAYTVTGIGINQARQIAYRNLMNYLGPDATYMDAYNGSLQAAQDLYGNPSTQYSAVRQAWYAVGIGNDPNSFCSGVTNLTESSGTITDGSGSANYNNNSNCKWVIAPSGANQISLTFTAFDTESNYDSVFVYDGPDETYPVLATWWGNTLPPVISTSSGVGAMCIRFSSDILQTESGWSANYQTNGNTPSCGGSSTLSAPSGTFTDGSNSNNYGNNQECSWIIAPPCATSVSLSFSQFNTELNYDGIIVYSDLEGTNQIGVFTGTSIPSTLTSNTGVMLVMFISDYSTNMQGFTANYTSTGSAYCAGTTNLNTDDYAEFSDGSAAGNYCNNQDCKWLIQPPQATSITLNFTEFELEEPSTDGAIYDAVEVYDGTSTSATLLGRFTGGNLPPEITSNGGSMLVRFVSDLTENMQGFSAYYTSTQTQYCSGTSTTLNAQSGSFTDGSAANNYANNTNCSWLIQPANAKSITLSFSNFNTELDYDGVVVYDGANNSAPILKQFSGLSLPNSVTSSGGSMYVEFVSDPAIRGQGWSANYTSTISTGIQATSIQASIFLYPNPTAGIFIVNSVLENTIELEICDLLGNQVLKSLKINKGTNQIDASGLSKGVYLIKLKNGAGCFIQKLVID